MGFEEEFEELSSKYRRTDTAFPSPRARAFGLAPLFGDMADGMRRMREAGHPIDAYVLGLYNDRIGAFGMRIISVAPGRDESGGLVEQFDALLRQYPVRNVAFDVVNSLRALADHVRQLREAGDPNPESVIDELNRLIAPYGLKLIVIPVTKDG